MDYNFDYTIELNSSYREKISSNRELITVFTPSYNRARFLPRVAECLVNQTSKDFVWIVVNDGSEDNTDIVMKEIMVKETLPIKYISKSNGGKHTAFKAAIDNAETVYFSIWDDDDIYDPQIIEFYLNKWEEIKKKKLDKIGAIKTLAKREDGTYLTNFPITSENHGKEYVTTKLENDYVYHRLQENNSCYDTEKLKSIDLFPTSYWLFKQHKFFQEGIWHGRFARKYTCLFVNKAFREYRYDDDVSLMRQPKSHQFYLDRFINAKMIMDEQFDYISLSRKRLIKRCIVINWLRSYAGISFKDMIKHTSLSQLRFMYKMAYPTSFLCKMYVKIKC